MVGTIKSYIRFVLFHRWNKLEQKHFDFLTELYSKRAPLSKIENWVLFKIKRINNCN